MVIDRRAFIASLGVALVESIGGRDAIAAPKSETFVGARVDSSGAASIALFDLDGRQLAAADLPGRGHDFAVRRDGREVVAFARRPGDWAVVLDPGAGVARQRFQALPGHHFVGHGVYSADGRRLYAAEEDAVTGQGAISVRDPSASYAPIGVLPSHGIGPHDLALMPDGRILVANGGIPVDPTTREDKPDPATMRSDLTLMAPDGRALERFDLDSDLRLSSLRHLSVAPSGAIAFGCQWQGAAGDGPMLVGRILPGKRAELIEIDDALNARFDNYIGAVAFDARGEAFVATSPRGGVAGLFDVTSGRLIGMRPVADVCGAAGAGAGVFVLSSGVAGVKLASATERELKPLGATDLARWAWDNHLRRLPGGA